MNESNKQASKQTKTWVFLETKKNGEGYEKSEGNLAVWYTCFTMGGKPCGHKLKCISGKQGEHSELLIKAPE